MTMFTPSRLDLLHGAVPADCPLGIDGATGFFHSPWDFLGFRPQSKRGASRIVEILSDPSYKVRRSRLRTFVNGRVLQPVLREPAMRIRLEEAWDASPLIGTCPGQIDPRRNASGLKDTLDIATLTWLAWVWACGPGPVGKGAVSMVLDAIQDPAKYGIKATDVGATRTATDYIVGRPAGLTVSAFGQLLAAIEWWRDNEMPKPEAEPAAAAAPAATSSEPTYEMGPSDVIRVVCRAAGDMRTDPKAIMVALLEERRGPKGMSIDLDIVEAAAGGMSVIKTSALPGRTSMRKGGEWGLYRGIMDRIGGTPILHAEDGGDTITDLTPAAVFPTKSTKSTKYTPAKETEPMEETNIEPLDALIADLGGYSSEAVETHESDLGKKLTGVPAGVKSMLDAGLAAAGLMSLDKLVAQVLIAESQKKRAQAEVKKVAEQANELSDEVKNLKTKLASATGRPAAVPMTTKAETPVGAPTGSVEWAPACDVFSVPKEARKSMSFEVPTWTWDHAHPDVPVVDADYEWRPRELTRVLYAISMNARVYLNGHTGSGKTTLIQQVAARTSHPFWRLNLDSEISRMDLMGRDTLVSDGSGGTISKFVEGVIPARMCEPYFFVLDEFDFARSDVAYVLQRVLEADSLVVTEDGGRVVDPHPFFRLFATGNTVGQGDEWGMYAGARQLSLALLNRFSVWLRVDYLSSEQRKRLLEKRVPALDGAVVQRIDNYVSEHLEAFTGAKVIKPISPRDFIEVGKMAAFYEPILGSADAALREAITASILDSCVSQDRAVLQGILDRVVPE